MYDPSAKEAVVGPGTYEPNMKNKEKAAGWVFGSEDRSKTGLYRKSETPAPGSYEYTTSIGKGRAYGMRIKTATTKKTKTPGPGTYEPSHDAYSTKRKPAAVGIGTSQRKALHNTRDTPGPGSYQHKKLR